MKKAVFLPLLFFIACKKDRVCNCTITTVGTTTSRAQVAGLPPLVPETDSTTYQPLYTVNTQKKTYPEVSKSDMRSACFSKSEESVNRSSTTTVPGIYTLTTTDTGTRNYECKIEN